MESMDLNMEDIFDRGDGHESHEDIGHWDRNNQVNDGEDDNEDGRNAVGVTEGDEVLSNLKDISKESTRKRASRQQIKLDVDRLKSSRGLQALPNILNKVHLKGKGYEAHDLDLIMTHVEHWAHRLMPKMPFYEFVERMEKLGTKKEVQTCLKRIRLDLPFFDSNINEYDEADRPNSPANIDNRDDDGGDDDNGDDNTNQAALDNFKLVSSNKFIHTLDEVDVSTDQNHVDGSTTNNDSIDNFVLTESMKERMERNRQLALQRRAMKMSGGSGSGNVNFGGGGSGNININNVINGDSR